MLSATNTAPILPHTNQFAVPQAIRSTSSPSGSLPTLQHARATSLDLDPGSRTHSLSASPSAPSHLHSQLYPRSSILINPRKRPYSGVIYANPALLAGASTVAAPVVTHIPAVPSRKEREKERERARERDKEREREREKAKSKDDEKIWGIPKKALLLGLGDLNFNAQMAMMAGWGHGSGGASILPSTAVTANDRTRIRPSSSSDLPKSGASSLSSKRSAHDSDSDSDSKPEHDGRRYERGSSTPNASSQSLAVSTNKSSQAERSTGNSPVHEPMDPEELAALNAIINTRRSMAAAQALVSGSIALTPPHLRASSFGSSAQDLSRPPLEEKRFESQDSVPSMSSVGHSSASIGSSNLPLSPSAEKGLQPPASITSSTSTAEIKSPRIRFAPLPTPTSAPSLLGRASQNSIHPGLAEALIQDSEESDATDSDYDSDDDAKSMKGKWYLMGMPSAYFKPEYYMGKSNKRRNGKTNSITGFGGGGDADDNRSEDSHSLSRKSTASLSDAHSRTSENDDEERGRSSSAFKSKRKSSHSRRRSRSRTGAISSGDEEERARKRELIRRARPGGTGMVTLPDGTKIRARRVNDQPSQAEPEFIEWGFAGLAREASRRSLGGASGSPSLATTPNSSDDRGLSAYMEDNEDDEDGMAWVRRRRRERQAKARLESEQADKTATDAAMAAQNPTSTQASANVDHADKTATDEGHTADASIISTCEHAHASLTRPSTADTADNTVSTGITAPSSVEEPMPLSAHTTAQTENSDYAETSAPATRRQSLLTAIDASRPADAMVSDGNAFVSSPTSEEPPTHSLEASMLSEASNGDSAMGGSQILSRPARARALTETGVPGDSTPRQNTGLGLTADKAEEIRRRHEDEVAALGAEVLAQTRRNNQRRQVSASSRGLNTPHYDQDSAGEQPQQQHHQHIHASPAKNSNRLSQASVASPPMLFNSSILAKSVSRDSGYEKKSISRAVGSIMRKATNDSEKTVGHSNVAPFRPAHEVAAKKHEIAFPQMSDSVERERKHQEISAEAADAVRGSSSTASDAAHVGSSAVRSTWPESNLSRKSLAVGGYSASSASKSVSSLQGAGSTHAPSPVSGKRISLDPSVSTPVPSPWLPRRPDARGVSVVPLPQLGVRPERPREGRVWLSDDSDASDAGENLRIEQAEQEEEDDASDLDAEELLEEERKTVMQKKRATTRAAGQEIVHARLGKKTSARALSDLTASYDDMALSSSMSTRQRSRRKQQQRRSSMDPRMTSCSNTSRSAAAPRKTPPRLVRSHRSADEEAVEENEEENLWPAASATSKSGTPRPRHILVNLPGGPGIWDSKKGGGHNAVAAINSVAAARAKAIKKRAKDRRTSFELPPDWDDEMMDYGWPRSLKGSLY
ncbi:uncharacterized protein UHO2_04154 [Ustilago hordei]|uniref:Uncharacterized protein n=1 Tax=Ustilago hordei TaxID=120017 RepID=I2FWP3_USTHO|nr:uncharacterized protein UHO2_04154 [Ustilago hordei]CCF51336.1 uncharacterized protein UHOR_05277 [Ustilago hordei]SYW79511.1 uncharacterized protein UHO2_04154 [Ustilago hordei]